LVLVHQQSVFDQPLLVFHGDDLYRRRLDLFAIAEKLRENRPHLLELEGKVAALLLAGIGQHPEVRRLDLNPICRNVLLRRGGNRNKPYRYAENAEKQAFHKRSLPANCRWLLQTSIADTRQDGFVPSSWIIHEHAGDLEPKLNSIGFKNTRIV
jgi:hypothetical protein